MQDTFLECACQNTASVPLWTDVALVGVGVATLVLLLLSAGAAIWQVLASQRREKVNNSFEHIAIQTRDHDLIKMFEEFRLVRAQLMPDETITLGLDDVEGAEVSHHGKMLSAEDVVKKVFNYYEATAIGIKKQALNETIIKDWWRRSYVLDFADFAQYVYEKRARDDAPKLYSEYESIVKQWHIGNEPDRLADAQKRSAENFPG